MRSPLALLLLAATVVSTAASDGLYSASTVVTGQGEANRAIGFRQCLPLALVRVSGDQRLLSHPQLPALVADADQHIAGFRYRDRLAGKPIHDEQGTYDRPHDLTCLFDPIEFDALLERLGSRPWTAARPQLAVFLHVERDGRSFVLSADGNDLMNDSLRLAGDPLAMVARAPRLAALAGLPTGASMPTPDDWPALRRAAGTASVPLAGTLQWSDSDLGWIARWRMVDADGTHDWSVRGVSFDEAFRVAVRGAAQILSGNGAP